MDPVTATLPVAPDSVHSGAGVLVGAADGHPAADTGGASATEEDDSASAIDDDVGVEVEDDEDDAVLESEPQAASVMPSATAQAASATEEDPREKFTIVTLQPPLPDVARRANPLRGSAKPGHSCTHVQFQRIDSAGVDRCLFCVFSGIAWSRQIRAPTHASISAFARTTRSVTVS
ncbi:hypothetical protein MANY_13370 [Mycolicibacterium anyangense]|uniref:Uncharacterized protein n=1 Tax=Mycolicibacterium anyangense TaxID=1431246 RepID=A0A6N4W285_9MYCO|nr:hypothetical protein MANY_13370 [Mycolicibacterium anyangense]